MKRSSAADQTHFEILHVVLDIFNIYPFSQILIQLHVFFYNVCTIACYHSTVECSDIILAITLSKCQNNILRLRVGFLLTDITLVPTRYTSIVELFAFLFYLKEIE